MLLGIAGLNTKNSACRRCMLGFLFVIVLLSCKTPKETGITSEPLIVMQIKPGGKEGAYKTVIFKKSERIYYLPKSCSDNDLRLLEMSMKNLSPVIITRSDDHSDMILKVRKAK